MFDLSKAGTSTRGWRRSPRLKGAAALVFSTALCMLTIMTVVASTNAIPLTSNSQLLRIRSFPSGVFLAKISTIHHYKESRNIRLESNVNFYNLLGDLQSMTKNITDICKIAPRDEEILEMCRYVNRTLSDNVEKLTRDLKIELLQLPTRHHHTKTERTIQVNLTTVEELNGQRSVISGIFSTLNLRTTKYQFYNYLDMLSHHLYEYIILVNQTFHMIKTLNLPNEQVMEIERQVNNHLRNDEAPFPRNFAKHLKFTVHWTFLSTDLKLTSELRVMICDKTPFEEWRAVSVFDRLHLLKLYIPYNTIIINSATRKFFFRVPKSRDRRGQSKETFNLCIQTLPITIPPETVHLIG